MMLVFVSAWMALGMHFAFGANPFCEQPDYIVRAPARSPSRDLSLLLSPKETKDPEAMKNLSRNQGPYGHSELGFRYLARSFGYKGSFENPDAAEDWLEEQFERNPEYRGMEQVWNYWVRAGTVKLRARGEETSTELGALFEKRRDAIHFSTCVATDVAKLRCENFSQKTILAGARVYFGTESSRTPCSIRFNGGTLLGDAPDNINISISRKTRGCLAVPSLSGGPMADDTAYCVDGTDTQSWKWENPETSKKGGEPKATSTDPAK